MKGILGWLVLLSMSLAAAGCASTAKIESAVKEEKDRCETYTSKLLGPVLGEVKSLKDARSDLEAQVKSSQERIQSLVQSNKALSESIQAKKGNRQRQVKELVAEKDELSRKLGEAQKTRIALDRDRTNLRAKTLELDDELSKLRAAASKSQEEREAASARARSALETVSAALQAETQEGLASARQRDGAFELTLQEPLLFEPLHAKVTEQGAALLDRLGSALTGLAGFDIHVIGHSDNAPIQKGLLGGFANHWDLAAARAVAVTRYLHEKGGLSPRQIEAASRGEFHPLEPNSTPEGRKANRRMVFMFTPAAE
ncbi:MAG: OmpA family protein [Elusimicrobia bacterium]|nr:OmpA family protein [Elusimicrobiota bacterium]